jgi:hypothetical protein
LSGSHGGRYREESRNEQNPETQSLHSFEHDHYPFFLSGWKVLRGKDLPRAIQAFVQPEISAYCARRIKLARNQGGQYKSGKVHIKLTMNPPRRDAGGVKGPPPRSVLSLFAGNQDWNELRFAAGEASDFLKLSFLFRAEGVVGFAF